MKKHQVFLFQQESKSGNVFGCGLSGDSITLVSKLLNINNYEAAKHINQSFNLGLDQNEPTNIYTINKYKLKKRLEENFKKWELDTFILLCKILHILTDWEKIKDTENDLYVINT